MARTIKTQIVATNAPVGMYQFELQTVAVGIMGKTYTSFHSRYYGLEQAQRAQKALNKKLKLS